MIDILIVSMIFSFLGLLACFVYYGGCIFNKLIIWRRKKYLKNLSVRDYVKCLGDRLVSRGNFHTHFYYGDWITEYTIYFDDIRIKVKKHSLSNDASYEFKHCFAVENFLLDTKVFKRTNDIESNIKLTIEEEVYLSKRAHEFLSIIYGRHVTYMENLP